MTKAEKTAAIADLKEKFEQYSFFYVTDSSTLTVGVINKLRRKCFEQGVAMEVVKNKLALKALKEADSSKNYEAIFDAFHGPTTILFTETANLPARLIEEFRKEAETERPVLKAAYIDSAVFMGNEQLSALSKLKSREELIGDVIGLLQSPAKNVISALKSSGNKIAGLVKALEERAA